MVTMILKADNDLNVMCKDIDLRSISAIPHSLWVVYHLDLVDKQPPADQRMLYQV